MPKATMGRPPEYKAEYVGKVNDYLADRQDQDIQTVKQANEEKGYEMFDNKLKVKLPTIEGFALFIGVSKVSLYEWEKQNPDFMNALGKIRTEQHDRLINNGLSGDYNPTIAKLVLSSNHGYAEKTQQDNTHSFQDLTDKQRQALNKLMLPDVDQASPEQNNNGNDGGAPLSL